MPGGRQDRKREQAIAALLECGTLAEAAQRAKVSVRTLKVWLKEPGFLGAYRAAKRQLTEHAIGVLQEAAALAAATLRRSLRGGKVADRIRAALGILRHAVDAVELTDLRQRVEELERKLTEGKS
jgi:hypothetical protein